MDGWRWKENNGSGAQHHGRCASSSSSPISQRFSEHRRRPRWGIYPPSPTENNIRRDRDYCVSWPIAKDGCLLRRAICWNGTGILHAELMSKKWLEHHANPIWNVNITALVEAKDGTFSFEKTSHFMDVFLRNHYKLQGIKDKDKRRC